MTIPVLQCTTADSVWANTMAATEQRQLHVRVAAADTNANNHDAGFACGRNVRSGCLDSGANNYVRNHGRRRARVRRVQLLDSD